MDTFNSYITESKAGEPRGQFVSTVMSSGAQDLPVISSSVLSMPLASLLHSLKMAAAAPGITPRKKWE